MQNSTTVEFPGLGWTFNVPRVAISLFGIDIYWYAVCICTGIVLAIIYAYTNAKKSGIDPERMLDVAMIGIASAIVGGRIYYVIFDTHGTYNSFFDLINMRAGGIGIYGAIIAAFIGAGLSCKWRKVPMLPLFDLAGIGFLIGQTLGRWGNFFNQEAFGTNTTLPWGMYSSRTSEYLTVYQALGGTVPVDPSLPVHPTFLYESLWCAVGFVLLALYFKHRKFNGEILLFYIVWYGFGRFFIEGLRTDSLYIGNIRISQLVALASVIGGIAAWVFARMKNKGKELVVPEIPLRTAKVRIEGQERPVVVGWSIEEKTPTKQELKEMALCQIEKADKNKESGDKTETKALETVAEHKQKP